MDRFAWDSIAPDDYLGIATGHDASLDCILAYVRGFRGPGRDQISWGIILEEFLSCETGLIVFDVREATYPATNEGLAATFQEMAADLPPARLAVLRNHDQQEAMEVACAAANAAGHAFRHSTSETELLAWAHCRST